MEAKLRNRGTDHRCRRGLGFVTQSVMDRIAGIGRIPPPPAGLQHPEARDAWIRGAPDPAWRSARAKLVGIQPHVRDHRLVNLTCGTLEEHTVQLGWLPSAKSAQLKLGFVNDWIFAQLHSLLCRVAMPTACPRAGCKLQLHTTMSV